jgi:hypothetical protein
MNYNFLTKETQIATSFFLTGDALDPEQCTRLFGLCPTTAHRKGIFLANNKYSKIFPTPTGEWKMGIDYRVCNNIEDDIRVLLNKISPASKNILEICKKQGFEAMIFSFIHAYAPYPRLYLSPEVVVKFAELNLKYEIHWCDDTGFGDSEGSNKDSGLQTVPPQLMTCVEFDGASDSFRRSTSWLSGGTMEYSQGFSTDPSGNYLDANRKIVASAKRAHQYRFIAGDPPTIEQSVEDAIKLLPEWFLENNESCTITTFVEVYGDYLPILELPPALIKKMADIRGSYNIIWRRSDNKVGSRER